MGDPLAGTVVRASHVESREQAQKEASSRQFQVGRSDGGRSGKDQRRELGRRRIEPCEDRLCVAEHIADPCLARQLGLLERCDAVLGGPELRRQSPVLLAEPVVVGAGDVAEQGALGLLRSH